LKKLVVSAPRPRKSEKSIFKEIFTGRGRVELYKWLIYVKEVSLFIELLKAITK